VIQYLINMAFAFDQFFSTVLGGHPDETISQRLGRASLAGNKTASKFRFVVDEIVFTLTGEENHCLKSLYGSTKAKEIWNWGGSRYDLNVED
jgi:hypothetical protein